MSDTARRVPLCPGDRVIDASGCLAVYIRKATHRWNDKGAHPVAIADWASQTERETYEKLRKATAAERVAQGEFKSMEEVPAYLVTGT